MTTSALSSPEALTTPRIPRVTAVPALDIPPVGLIGLTPISGNVGKLIEFGQWLDGSGFKQWEHAFISVGSGQIVEAEPGGARTGSVTEYSSIYWCYGIYGLGTAAQLDATEVIARKYAGVPYSALDYFALAAHRLHLPVLGLENYIKSDGHMICSQLVDQVYNVAGIHVFTDGRWPGFVTPGNLYERNVALGGPKLSQVSS
jgi:hypothetical protein